MPDPRHAYAAGLPAKMRGFIEHEAREIAGADAQRTSRKSSRRPNTMNKERRRAQREADS